MKKANELLSNLSWKFAERIAAQMVTFVVSIILARLLDPSHYGIISIVTIFITLANVFVSDGLGSALIQKKDADALDFSSVLYFNIAFSVLLYTILYISAPYIALFYGEGYEILSPVLRVLGLRIILSAINSVQNAYISKKMMFRRFFWATLTGTMISAFVGITMAYRGYGVWALVAQYLTNTTVDTIFLAVSLKRKPVFKFSMKRVKKLLRYGFGILGTNLIITGYMELRAMIIGRLYSSADLAYYDKGKQFPNLIVANINTSIGAVLFPRLSKEQDNVRSLRDITRSSIRFSSYIMCPTMLGLAAVAESFVTLVLTEKWLPCVPLLRYFCVIFLFQPIHTANMQAIKAMGRSDIYLKLELLKKAIEIVVLIAVMWISVDAIVISMAILTSLFTFVNAYPNKKLMEYSFLDQVKDIAQPVIMSIVMMICVNLIGKIDMNLILLMGLQIVVGAGLYIFMSVILKNKEFTYICNRFLRKNN